MSNLTYMTASNYLVRSNFVAGNLVENDTDVRTLYLGLGRIRCTALGLQSGFKICLIFYTLCSFLYNKLLSFLLKEEEC